MPLVNIQLGVGKLHITTSWIHPLYEYQKSGAKDFEFKVTGVYQKPMDRILMEAINIKYEETGKAKTFSQGPLFLQNTKREYYGPQLSRISFHQW